MNVSMVEALEVCDIPPPGRRDMPIHCPFHAEDSASCVIYDDHWHCYGCGAGGSPVAFVARFYAEGEPAREHFRIAEKLIARTIDLDDETRPLYLVREPEVLDLTDEFAKGTIETEQALVEVLALFQRKWPHLTYSWVNHVFGVKAARWALWVPHYDHAGLIRGIKTRSFTDGSKKSVTGSTFTSRLYQPVNPFDHSHFADAWLCEGESDTWTMTQVANATPGPGVHVYGLPGGAALWRENFAQELLSYRNVVLFMDRDPAGRKAAERIGDDLRARGMSVLDYQLVDYGDVCEAVADGWAPEPIGAMR